MQTPFLDSFTNRLASVSLCCPFPTFPVPSFRLELLPVTEMPTLTCELGTKSCRIAGEGLGRINLGLVHLKSACCALLGDNAASSERGRINVAIQA